jgi:nucleoid-associated protein YgaU
MIVLQNGDFRALLLSEAVLGERRVRKDEQRPVPFAASHPFLYGCYVDGEAVRLVFNVAAIAMQFSLQSAPDVLTTLAEAFGFPPESLLQGVRSESKTDVAQPIQPASPAAPPAELDPAEVYVVPSEIPPRPTAREPSAETPRASAPDPRVSVALGPAGPAQEEAPETAEAPPAPEIPFEEPQLRISENAARPMEETPAAPPPAVEMKREDRPARRAHPVRALAIVAGALVVLAAAVILLVPGFRVRVFPGTAVKPTVVTGPVAGEPASSSVTAPVGDGTHPASPGAPSDYVVQEGDTLWGIAARFAGDPHEFRRLASENQIVDPDRIYPGERIRLTPKQ